MLGGTHKKIAIVASLAVLQPTTVPACLGTIAAGAIGGDICDIDILYRKHPAKDYDPDRDDQNFESWANATSNLILLLLFIATDWYFGSGAVDWFLKHLEIKTLAAAAVFALIVVCGMFAPHRAYTHSILAGLVLTCCLYIICAPLAPAFAIGYATHILLDLLNKTGMSLLWPIKKRFALNVCASNKTANAVLEFIGTILCDLIAAYFLIVALIQYDQSTKILEFLSAPYSDGITNLGAWLIFINVFTFFAENRNFSLWRKGKGPYQEHDEYFNVDRDNTTAAFMQRTLYILFVLGGALGGMLSYLRLYLKNREYIKNGALGLVIPLFGATSVVIEWTSIYLAIINPNNLYSNFMLSLNGNNLIYLLIYIIAMNVLTFVVYSHDNNNTKQLTLGKLAELCIALLGGAAGALLSINLKGFLGAQMPIKSTVSKMLQAHCLITALIITSIF